MKRYRGYRRVSVHLRDGYEASGAVLRPPARRGLVFIDPLFEGRDESERTARALGSGSIRRSS
jgi:23S rRNA (adenine2030-N6)-methyltransferase